MATALMMLVSVGCHRQDIVSENDADRLRFSPILGEAQTVTRAAESDNSILRVASPAGANSPHIVIDTYTGTPGSSLERYFADELGYSASEGYWDFNSSKVRFLPDGGMNLYAYFATKQTGKGDLTGVNYIRPAKATEHPQLAFKVAADDAVQVDLIAAKVEGITSADVMVPFRHILSQINFGVKGIDQHQITIQNIRIDNVISSGSFDYKNWQWTPEAKIAKYFYYFPDRKDGIAGSGLGGNYVTLGTLDDSKNSYIFGDGGKFGPGPDVTFLYAQSNPSTASYATQENTPASLHNSLMLLPQQIKQNTDATVTFDYEIKYDGGVVRSGTNSTIRLDTYHDWMPNLRYIYIFKFDDPQKVTFDVIVEQWENYNGGDGIVGTDELNPTTLFDKHVRVLKPGDEYSVPIGALTSDFLCDWSMYSLDNSFAAAQQFTLTFDSDLPFADGKSVVITPPFGFRSSTTKLTARGDVTFTAIHSYFAKKEELNAAISSGVGNYEFSVKDGIKLDDIIFAGSETAESSLTLHYLSSYGVTPPARWQMYNDKTAVCFPRDYAMTNGAVPYSYTLYTVQGLYKVFEWMNNGGPNPGDGNSALSLAERMQTNISLARVGSYNLAEVYKSSSNASRPEFVPIGGDVNNPYSGTFNGNGATVENLYIKPISGDSHGLFGFVSKEVKFVNLTKVDIYSGGTFAGGVAGKNAGGKITGCSVSGSVHGGYTGGIVGENSGLLYSCGSTASVTTYSPGNVGGISGFNWSTIQGCYSTSSGVNVNGDNRGTISKCFYVATSDAGTNPAGVTRVPSIAALNGKTPILNAQGGAYWTGAHFVSGNLNATPPSIAAGDPADRAKGGVLKGTFIQNWFALGFDEARWDAEMAILAALGMEYLVIDQVMVLSGNQYVTWYPATKDVLVNDKTFDINSGNALTQCMTACRAHGIKVFVGTMFDNRYWDDGKAVTYPQEWNNCITTSNNVMRELTKFYFNGPSSTLGDYTDVLAGWYFPYEVDDLFKSTEAQALIMNGIKSAITCRDGLAATARKPYLFSPFMNGSGPEAAKAPTMSATEYAALWSYLISNAGFKSGDILSPQDCIGVRKLLISDIKPWMSALKGATSNGVEFWINVELFGPGADISFLTKEQIPANREHAETLISFSYPIHYSPNSVGYTVGDHNAYKLYYDAQ